MWPPRSPCGENRVLRYGTVRYMYLCMRHFIMSAAFCYLSTCTLQVPTSARTGHVFSLPPGMEVPFHDAALPPTGNQIIFYRSPNDIHLSLSLSYIIHSAPYNIPTWVTRHTYINNQNPPSLPLFCQATQTTIIKQTAMCSDVQYPIPRNRKLLNRVRYCTSFYAEATR